ncbi:MAG: hypothetical protein R3B99_12320 [Polyangiales bacterium]
MSSRTDTPSSASSVGDARALATQRREQHRRTFDQRRARDASTLVHEQRGRDERGRRHHRHAVDLVGHAVADALHQRAPFGRRDVLAALRALFPERPLQDVVEAQHLAELHVEPAVLRPEHLRGLQQSADVLLLLLAAAELVHVAALFDDALVADAHRHEEDLLAPELQRGVDHHRQQAELRREQLARARASALDEELEREALDDQPAHVGVDEHGVELLALERPADEERAAPPEDRAEREEREVVARGDERRRERLPVEHHREHEVVDVALVARQVDQGTFARGLANALDAFAVDDHTVVDAVEDPPEHPRQERDHVGHLVGAELLEVLARLRLHLRDAHVARARFFDDVLANPRRSQQLVLDARRRLLRRPEHQRPLALDATQQRVADFVGGFGVREVLVVLQERLQIEGLARTQQRVAVVEEELEEDANAAGPLDRSEEEVDQPPFVFGGELRPDEGLRDQEDRLLEPSLRLDQRSNQVLLERLAFSRPASELRRTPQEEQGGEPLRDHVRERLLLGDLPLEPEPTLAPSEGLEDPQPQVVDETNERKPEALQQEIEAEEVEERERAHHVDDDTAPRAVADRAAPRFVDLHVREEPAVDPTKQSVRLVGLHRRRRARGGHARSRLRPAVGLGLHRRRHRSTERWAATFGRHVRSGVLRGRAIASDPLRGLRPAFQHKCLKLLVCRA